MIQDIFINFIFPPNNMPCLFQNLDGDFKNVAWQRYATGFNQPVAIHVDQDGVFILDRG